MAKKEVSFCGVQENHVLHTWGETNGLGCLGWPIPREFFTGPEEVEMKDTAIEGEAVSHPLHYGGDTVYEAIKVIHAWGLNFDLGNVVKYISRAGKKPLVDEIEDMKKAQQYMKFHIKELKKARRRGSE